MRKEIYEKNGNQESSDTLPFHWEFGKEEITVQDLPPTPRWHSTFQGLPSMTGKGWKNFADNGDWIFQKNRKKSKGNRQEKRKEKERDRSIWK